MTRTWTKAVLSALALCAGAGTAGAQDRNAFSYDRLQAQTMAPAERSALRPKADTIAAQQGMDSTGKLSNFRPRRNGQQQWVEPEAREMAYEDHIGVIEMTGAARVRQMEDRRLINEMEEDRISYEIFKEKTSARQRAKPANVRMLISPPRQPEPAYED
jgi:lipopolysaccharide transport protein LptA